MARQSTIPAQIVLEEIRSIEEYTGSLVRVLVGTVDADGEFIIPQNFQSYEISGEDLKELMSESPEWAEGKPAGTYRNEDLWVFIDRARAKGDKK